MKFRYAMYGLAAGLVLWWVADQSAPGAVMLLTMFTVTFVYNAQLAVNEQEDEIRKLKDRLDNVERQRGQL
ncbi:hypothetical protein ACFFJB_14925 [Camelimonas abortus]|uniref:Uncharacterized protein n=1 Tax=Camelimonas abortus TaxID=1017184 RepID=A0ABV7LHQ2_9HYPH